MNTIESCLYRADFRQIGGRWRKTLDGHGLPLSDRDLAINAGGGMDYGVANASNSRTLLQSTLQEWEYRLEDGEEWRRDWIADAKVALRAW